MLIHQNTDLTIGRIVMFTFVVLVSSGKSCLISLAYISPDRMIRVIGLEDNIGMSMVSHTVIHTIKGIKTRIEVRLTQSLIRVDIDKKIKLMCIAGSGE
jgi:hypothetical protein